MDLLLSSGDFFNNGINAGDIDIYGNDNQKIRAHRLVLENTCGYFQQKIKTISAENTNNQKNIYYFDYDIEIIIGVINCIYSSEYLPDISDPNKMIQFMDFWGMLNIRNETDMYAYQKFPLFFSESINYKNWSYLLMKLSATVYACDYFLDELLAFFKDNVITSEIIHDYLAAAQTKCDLNRTIIYLFDSEQHEELLEFFDKFPGIKQILIFIMKSKISEANAYRKLSETINNFNLNEISVGPISVDKKYYLGQPMKISIAFDLYMKYGNIKQLMYPEFNESLSNSIKQFLTYESTGERYI